MTRLKIFIFITFFTLSHNDSAANENAVTTLNPTETYSISTRNPILIRIGNGSTAANGIIRALAQDYLQMNKPKYALAWYQDTNSNNMKQLEKGIIDIALVYDRSSGYQALKAGWATNYTAIFNDHFIIIGPKENPASLDKKDTAITALTKIAKLGNEKSANVFLSRDDNSISNIKEKNLWKTAALQPWTSSTWYLESNSFPSEALLKVDESRLYTLTDWGTWLSNKASLKHSKIYVQGGDMLLNQCFALLGKNPNQETLDFLTYLKSPRAQQLIALFGKNLYGGFALFTPANQVDF